jgi:hypothetical protein
MLNAQHEEDSLNVVLTHFNLFLQIPQHHDDQLSEFIISKRIFA